MFAADRDLLILEPNLFRDVGWVGQRLVKGTGTISGVTLTITGYDVDFASAGVGAGHVASVDDVPYEVVERLSATEVVVSRVRLATGDPLIPPTPVAGKPVSIVTFRPQIGLVHAQVLRMIGIEPEDPPEVGAPTEESITNPSAFTRMEAHGALHLVYSAASAPADGGWANSVWTRAQFHRELFAQQRRQTAARLDLDGDGVVDATRPLGVMQLVRGV